MSKFIDSDYIPQIQRYVFLFLFKRYGLKKAIEIIQEYDYELKEGHFSFVNEKSQRIVNVNISKSVLSGESYTLEKLIIKMAKDMSLVI